MATDNAQHCLSFAAGADLSAAQYRFVKLGAAGTVTLCAAETDRPIGVLQNRPTTGQLATVCVDGVTKVQADEVLTTGVEVTTSADGQAITDATADVGARLVGIVIDGASAAGNLATVLISCQAGARLTV
jgi:hypothetical protein